MRRLLYHRDLDDSIGTYITDYAVVVAVTPLCIYLLIRICKSKPPSIWPPWNRNIVVPPVTLMSYSVLVYSTSMVLMALFAGIAHQTLQKATNYESWRDNITYLLLWKIGTAFLSPALLALMCMADKIVEQETLIKVPTVCRKLFYIFSFILSLAVLAYNFIHMAISNDPFNLKNLFMAFFLGIGIYGFACIFVLINRLCRWCCCASDNSTMNISNDSINTKHSSVLKIAVGRCNDLYSNSSEARSVPLDLVLHVLAPWVFFAAGVTNFSLRTKCSDSHDAYHEKGCPLPNEFNHNALFHTLYTVAIILLIVAELLAIKRRLIFQKKIENSREDSLLNNNVNEEKHKTSINRESIV